MSFPGAKRRCRIYLFAGTTPGVTQSTWHRVATILLTLTVVASVLSIAGAAQQPPPVTEPQDAPASGIDPVDELYVENNGDAVAVIEEDAGASDTEFGVDVGENLMHLLVEQPVPNADARGNMSLVLNETAFDGDGTLSLPQPSSLSSFSLSFVGETTAENAASDLSLDTTVETGAGRLLESASTTGTVTTTASSFTATGSVDAQLSQTPMRPSSASYALTESDGQYTVTVERNRTVRSFQADQWRTRQQAKETLQQRFLQTAEQYGGSATVNIDRYDFEQVAERTFRLDLAYTVSYDEVESAVASAVSGSTGVDAPSADEDIDAALENLSVNRIAASYDAGSNAVTADFEADIENYNDLLLATSNLSSTQRASTIDPDRFRAQLAAQQAADLERTLDWEGSVTRSGSSTVSLQFDASQRTTNWAAYVDELETRGIQTPQTQYNFTGESDGDRVNLTGTMTVRGSLLDRATNQAANVGAGEGSNEFVAAFLRSDLRTSQLDASIRDGNFRLEAGAQFDNLSAFRDTLAENEVIPDGLSSAVTRTEDNTTTTYVRVSDAVGADATESDVRSLSYVDSETTVNMPGEWNRAFPEMDTQRAQTYLNAGGVSATPGFGAFVPLVALLIAALVARRHD